MGTYRVAEICPNGHVSTTSADTSPELREKYCSQCGEATITACPSCKAPLRGYYHVDGVFSLGGGYEPPAYCYNCGVQLPWTGRKVAAAVELLEASGELTGSELMQFREDLTELTKDSPRVQVASLRFKRVMSKAGSAMASGVRDIIVDILSEAAKKAIWGNGA